MTEPWPPKAAMKLIFATYLRKYYFHVEFND